MGTLMVATIQDALLHVTPGYTTVLWDVVVTRWAKDCYELDTLTGDVTGGSEWAAEEIATRKGYPLG